MSERIPYPQAIAGSRFQINKFKHLIGIELPQGDYEFLQEQDRQPVVESFSW